MPVRDAVSILILKLSSLGDVLHTLPALSALRKGYPDADITWVIDERLQGILEGNPDLTRIIALNKKNFGSLPAWRNAGGLLRSSQPDLCVDFQGLFYTGLLSYLSGAKRRIGFASAREFSPLFYTGRARIPFEGIHAVERYLKLARYAGGAESAVEFKIVTGEEDREYVRGILGSDESGPNIAVHAGARWQTKRWTPEGFAKAADYLAGKYKARVILIGAKDEEPYNNRIKSLMKTALLDLSGRTTLKQLAALFEKTDLLITNDSGPMHLAAALGTPVLAIFGPTDPVRTGPYGQEGNVIRRDSSCSPCFKKRCRGMICLDEIPIEDVISAAERIMERT